MGNATSVRRSNTVTKQNIAAAHADIFKRTSKEVKPSAIFAQIMDYPQLSHARHTERFARLLVNCVRTGMINPLELEKV